MADEIKIKVTADTKDFSKEMDEVDRKIDKTADKSEKSQSKWGQLNSKLSSISPTFKKLSDTWQESSSKIDGAFGKSSGAAKLFKLGVIGALAAIAAKAAKVAWQFASDTAKMFDPKGYSKAAGAMQKSVKKLKTTIGSFTAPLVNGIMTVVSKVVDGITWILEKIRLLRSFLWGVIKGVIQPIIDAVKKIIDWIKQGINALAGFLGFGDVFKKSSDSAAKTADSMGEVVEATSAGLAGFDKLNTLDMSNSGDTEQADKLKEGMEDASKLGEEIGQKIRAFLDNFSLTGIKDKIKGVFENVGKWGGEAWSKITKFGGDTWTTIQSIGGSVWSTLTKFGGDTWTTIQSVGSTVWTTLQGVGTTVWTTLQGVGSTAWTTIQSVGSTVWSTLQGVGSTVWTTISGVATTVWTTIQSVAQTVWGGISGFATDAWNGIQTIAETVWGVIQTAGQKFKDHIMDPIKAVWDKIKEIVDTVLGKIEDMISKVRELKDGLVGGVTSFAKDPVGGIKSIPGKVTSKIKGALGLASGGAVAPNNPMPYILGDNTREYEVVSPVSMMKDAVKSAISEMGGAGRQSSGPIELVVNLDGRKIARAVYDPLQTESRRRGSRA